MGDENTQSMDVDYIITILAIDRSGSTNVHTYWEKCNNYKIRFDDETSGQQKVFLLWNHECSEVEEREMNRWISNRQGTGGTTLQNVCQYILSKHPNKIINLYLVSDGQISNSDVQRCDELTREMRLNKVDIAFFSSSSYSTIESLSIAAPFMRESDHIVAVDGETITRANTKVAFQMPVISTIREFEEKREELEQQIANRYGGIGNKELAKQLLDLKSRLMKELAAKKSEGFEEEAQKLEDSLKQGNYIEAIQALSFLSPRSDDGSNIERSILHLINICENPKDFSYNVSDYKGDAALSRRLERKEEVVEMDLPDVETRTPTGGFQCPVARDDDTAAILVKEVHPLLTDLDKNTQDQIMNCPLTAITFPEIRERITSMLEQPVGVDKLQKIMESRKSPVTRIPVMGALPLTKAPDSVAASTWTLAKAFWDGKLVGNHTLWMCVIYFLILEMDRLQYLRDNNGLMNDLKNHLKYLLQTEKTSISLSGVPQYPMEKVHVGVAVWYVIASGDIYAEQNFDQDRLRHFSRIIPFMTQLLDLLDFPYNKEYTKKRAKIMDAFSYMMLSKQDVEKLKELLLSSEYEKIPINDEGKFVLTENKVEKIPDDFPEVYKKLDLPELKALLKLVDPSKKVSKVFIPKELPIQPETEVTSSYGYPVDVSTEPRTVVCPGTMRPYSKDPGTEKNWNVASAEFYRCDVKLQISLYQYYIDYVTANNEFPKENAFLLYVYEQEKKNQHEALPRKILAFLNNTFSSFEASRRCYEEQTGKELDVTTFVTMSTKSMNKDERRLMERKWEEAHPGTMEYMKKATRKNT